MYEPPHLLVAARQDDLAMCDFLIRQGIDVNRGDNDGCTPLAVACAKVMRRMSTSLRSNRAKHRNFPRVGVGEHCVDGFLGHNAVYCLGHHHPNPPMCGRSHYPQLQGHDKIVKLLMNERSIEVDLQDSIGRTALYHAADHGEDEIVTILIVNDADVNIRGPNERSVLTTAAARGHLQIVKFLLSQEVRRTSVVCPSKALT